LSRAAIYPPSIPASLEPTVQPISNDVVDGEPALAVFKVTDRSIEAPEHIPAGLTTIRLENAGTVEHSLVIFDIDEGHTVANVALELTGQFWPESWAPSVGQVTADVGESSEGTVRLKKGLLRCDGLDGWVGFGSSCCQKRLK